MKILSLTPQIKQNEQNVTSSMRLNYHDAPKADMVTFKAAKKKIIPKNILDNVNLDNFGEIGSRIKTQLEDPKSRGVLLGVLLGMASAITDTFVNGDNSLIGRLFSVNPESTPSLPKTAPKKGKKPKANSDTQSSQTTGTAKANAEGNSSNSTQRTSSQVNNPEDNTSTNAQNASRKGKRSGYTKEELKAKIQEGLNNGIPKAQLAKNIGISLQYLYALIKDFKLNESSENQTPSVFTDEDKQRIQKMLQNPETKSIIMLLKGYPNLAKNYAIIYEQSKADKNNKDAKFIITTLNSVFEKIAEKRNIANNPNQKWLDLLEKYSDNLVLICIDLTKHMDTGRSMDNFFLNLNDSNVNTSILEEYMVAGRLSLNEFMNLKDKLPETQIDKLINLKQIYNIYDISLQNVSGGEEGLYVIHLTYGDKTSLKSKIKAIIDFNNVIHGKSSVSSKNEQYTVFTLIDELLSLAQKDNDLVFGYNIAKFLQPKNFESFDKRNKTPIDKLPIDSKEFERLRRLIINTIENVDTKSVEVQTLLNLMNNKDIDRKLFVNNHALIRLIGRIVLKQPTTPRKLESACKDRIEIVSNQIDVALEEGADVFPHRMARTGEILPSTYAMTEHIKVIFDKHGNVYTIFQDLTPKNSKN